MIDRDPGFSDLFAQLGLHNTPHDIADFIARHRPLDGNTFIWDAPFWTPSQAAFLKEKRAEDSPTWVMLIDQLSTALREPAVQP